MTLTAADVVAHAEGRPATLGRGRLVCIDGPAGSGKTTLAAAVATLSGAPVVHMDDLYDGWSGLPRVGEHVLGLLRPLAEDRPGRYRRYDWIAEERAEEHIVEPVPVLVLEGVGSWGRAWAPLVTTLVWVEAAAGVRLERGVARDGEALRPRWEQWMRDEEAHFTREGTRARADLVLRT